MGYSGRYWVGISDKIDIVVFWSYRYIIYLVNIGRKNEGDRLGERVRVRKYRGGKKYGREEEK